MRDSGAFTFYASADEVAALDAAAARLGLNRSEAIREAIAAWMASVEPTPEPDCREIVC